MSFTGTSVSVLPHADTFYLTLYSIVTVSMAKYQTDKILPMFAKCLAALPNLHTIQITYANSAMSTPIKNAFEGISLPTVRTMIVPPGAHEILRRCPGVEDLTANEYEGSGDFVDGGRVAGALVAAKCKLKTMRRINPNKAMVKRVYCQAASSCYVSLTEISGIAKVAPDLKLIEALCANCSALPDVSHIVLCIIHCRSNLPQDFVKEFAGFKKLQTIEIKFSPDVCRWQDGLNHKKAAVMDAGKEVLKASQAIGEKKIVLISTRSMGKEQVSRGFLYDMGYVRVYERETVVVS